MPNCQAPNCSFFAPEGGRYCSSHFKTLASPEEREAANAVIAARELAIVQARAAWDQALDGPLETANEALLQAIAMSGFKESWIDQELETAFNSHNLQRIERMQTCEAIQYENRMAFPALLYKALQRGHRFDDPLIDAILAHPSINEDSLDFDILQSEIYHINRDIRLLTKILAKGKITQRLVDAARFSVKRPQNRPSPAQNEIVKLVEDLFKERQKEARLARKRAAEEEAETKEESKKEEGDQEEVTSSSAATATRRSLRSRK